MSRTFKDRPGFRLRFACAAITLDRSDRPGELRVLNPDAPDLLTDLRALAAEIAASRGRLTVELPASEVWRGPVPGLGRLGREKAARDRVAARLGLPPAAVSLRIGGRDAGGATQVAAVATETVAETRRFLAQAGLRAGRITGGGAFPGFAAAPDFAAPARPALRRLGPASAAAAVAAALVLAVLTQAPDRGPAVVAAPLEVEPGPALAAASAPADPAQPRPRPRPADLTRVAVAPEPAPVARIPAPQAPRAPGHAREPALLPLVTVATRNFPVSTLQPRPQADGTIRLAELSVARARLDDTRIDAPMQRPAAAAAPKPAEAAVRIALADPTAPAPSSGKPALRPLARPAAAAAEPSPAPTPAAVPETAAAAPDRTRPQPRPQSLSSAALSQAISAAVVTASVAGPTTTFATQTASTGLAAASVVAAGRPEPRRFTASRAPAPAPAKVKVATVRPKPVAAAPQKVARLAPAPAQPARVQPKQVRVQKAPAKVQPKAVASVSGAAATQTVGFSRNSVSLIGIFGGGDDRHALVRLPGGRMQRVRAGDRLQGARVAAIGKDSLQLSGGGKNAVLTMPN